eukprot:g5752.t1
MNLGSDGRTKVSPIKTLQDMEAMAETLREAAGEEAEDNNEELSVGAMIIKGNLKGQKKGIKKILEEIVDTYAKMNLVPSTEEKQKELKAAETARKTLEKARTKFSKEAAAHKRAKDKEKQKVAEAAVQQISDRREKWMQRRQALSITCIALEAEWRNIHARLDEEEEGDDEDEEENSVMESLPPSPMKLTRNTPQQQSEDAEMPTSGRTGSKRKAGPRATRQSTAEIQDIDADISSSEGESSESVADIAAKAGGKRTRRVRIATNRGEAGELIHGVATRKKNGKVVVIAKPGMKSAREHSQSSSGSNHYGRERGGDQTYEESLVRSTEPFPERIEGNEFPSGFIAQRYEAPRITDVVDSMVTELEEHGVQASELEREQLTPELLSTVLTSVYDLVYMEPGDLNDSPLTPAQRTALLRVATALRTKLHRKFAAAAGGGGGGRASGTSAGTGKTAVESDFLQGRDLQAIMSAEMGRHLTFKGGGAASGSGGNSGRDSNDGTSGSTKGEEEEEEEEEEENDSGGDRDGNVDDGEEEEQEVPVGSSAAGAGIGGSVGEVGGGPGALDAIYAEALREIRGQIDAATRSGARQLWQSLAATEGDTVTTPTFSTPPPAHTGGGGGGQRISELALFAAVSEYMRLCCQWNPNRIVRFVEIAEHCRSSVLRHHPSFKAQAKARREEILRRHKEHARHSKYAIAQALARLFERTSVSALQRRRVVEAAVRVMERRARRRRKRLGSMRGRDGGDGNDGDEELKDDDGGGGDDDEDDDGSSDLDDDGSSYSSDVDGDDSSSSGNDGKKSNGEGGERSDAEATD